MKKLKISYNAVYYSLHRTSQTGTNQNRKRSGRPRCTTKQEDKYNRVSSLKNRRLTSPQMAASLNSTCKTPVSTSTVKMRLLDAGLLDRIAKKKPYLRLANKNKKLRLAKEHRHWTEELCLEELTDGLDTDVSEWRERPGTLHKNVRNTTFTSIVFFSFFLIELYQSIWGERNPVYSAPGSGYSCCIRDTTQEGLTTDKFAKVAPLTPDKMPIGTGSLSTGNDNER